MLLHKSIANENIKWIPWNRKNSDVICENIKKYKQCQYKNVFNY